MIVVEDGSIVENANSYVSVATFEAYAAARGITLTGDSEQLLIQAMDYIEGLNYQGRKVSADQPLQWPRSGVIIDGYYVDSDVIPQELKNGEMQTAIAIDMGQSPLASITQNAIRKKVGSIEIEYSSSSSNNPINKQINYSLQKLLGSGNFGSGTIKVSKA